MKNIVLASGSPRRKELLQLCGFPFSVEVANVNEEEIVTASFKTSQQKGLEGKLKEGLSALTMAKAKAVAKKKSDSAVVIGADTIVLLNWKILGKPKTKEEAQEMLRSLVGKRHEVYTAVAICHEKKVEHIFSKASVYFHPEDTWTEKLIHDYIQTQSPFDKAGGYGIQDKGALFVEKIEGDYYTVMGFPVADVWRKLNDILYPV